MPDLASSRSGRLERPNEHPQLSALFRDSAEQYYWHRSSRSHDEFLPDCFFLVFFAPLILFLGCYPACSLLAVIFSATDTSQAWLAFSSYLGSRFHSRFVRSARPGLDSYGRDYLRTMVNTGPAMSEQIELDNMLVESDHEE